MDATTVEQTAIRIANTLGPACAAAQALRELEKRRAEGKVVSLFIVGNSWVVAASPTPQDKPTTE